MNVIVGIDDSIYSNEAIRYICDSVWPKAARFLVVSAVPVIAAGPGETITGEGLQTLTEEQQRYHHGVVSRAAARLRKAGLHAETLVVYGDPRSILTNLVRSEQANLLVVGSHGRSGLTKLLLGSVASHLVTHSECPVLVVKSPSWTTPGRLHVGSASEPVLPMV
jgi:nucleotide-binding universal stress UspA family protein